MNVLLITFSFPPVGGVGVLRALSLAKYLPSEGIRVDVLTARNAPAVGRDQALLQQVPADVTIHRTWTLDLPFTLRKGIKKLLTRGKAPRSSSALAPAGRPGLMNRLQGLIANLLLPDPQIGWLPFAYPAARRIIRSRKIDAVIITVPPFSSVKLAARLRKAFPALPIVLDFRDEWLTTTLELVSFNSNERARRIARQTESEAVDAATAVVAVTRNAADELRKRYPHQPATKFLTVPNGYDDTPSPRLHTEPKRVDKVTLTYMGSVYGTTDPRTLLEAVAGLPADVRDRLRIRFIGHVETPAYRQALAALAPTVELVGFLSMSEAHRQLAASHYALLITRDPINVSAKFYDYLGAGKPILAAVHPEGEVRRLLDETGAGEWASINDPAALRQLLVEAVNRVTPEGSVPYRPSPEAVAAYHRKPLTRRYASLLQSFSQERA
ncbi:glycosyl transferase [Cystobacter fuscus]|uniref:Glycosyl transferase n=1 Tax=Cystobacter fuscus TaxID=43 RepID=A0A250J1S7_9BACT|nr:glycosyltransferase [Cystobacter fuscus]ATB37480.1 glycosyl transferase [Cystobacter fuscus]